MYNEDIRLAIDVGSSKVCSVVARRDTSGEFEILAVNAIPSPVTQAGEDVVSRGLAADTVKASIEEVSRQTSLQFDRAYVGIGGKHVNSYTGVGRVSDFDFSAGVTEEDVVQAVRIAASTQIDDSHHLLYASPTGYQVDGDSKFMKPPIGMHPNYLEVEALLVVSDMMHYENVFSAVREAGINPIHGGSTLVAESEYLLSEYEREVGVVLVDIGGTDSEIAIYYHGKALAFTSIPVGGFHFTNDLTYVFELPFENSEQIKVTAGSLIGDTSEGNDEIDPRQLGDSDAIGQTGQSITRVSVGKLLRQRASETLMLYRARIEQIEDLPELDQLTLVFTGGGSKLNGFAQFAKLNMNLRGRVETRKPINIRGLPDNVSDPSMSGAVCMVMRALDRLDRDNHVKLRKVTKPVTEVVLASNGPHNVSSTGGVGARLRAILRR